MFVDFMLIFSGIFSFSCQVLPFWVSFGVSCVFSGYKLHRSCLEYSDEGIRVGYHNFGHLDQKHWVKTSSTFFGLAKASIHRFLCFSATS